MLGWLTWYERRHDRDRKREDMVKIFIAWSTGAEYWQLARRFALSERTLRRRIDDLCVVIFHQFGAAYRKIFLDEWHECQPKGNSSSYGDDLASDDTTFPKTPPNWIADGAKPSADKTIPAVAEARAELTERIEHGNRKRRKAERRTTRSAKNSDD